MTVLFAVPASAGVEHENLLVKGGSAQASWHTSDGCTFTSVDVWVGEQVARASGAPEYAAWGGVNVSMVDICNADFRWYSGPVLDGIEIDGVDSASIVTELELTGERCSPGDGDFVCEPVAATRVPLSLTFTGDGEAVTGRSVSSWHVGRTRGMSRHSGVARDATVTGSFVLDGAELIAGDPYARIEQVTDGRNTIYR